MNRFSDKVAVITDAAYGIGMAAARLFAAEGGKVVVADLNVARGEALAAEIGGLFVQADVASEEAIEALLKKTLEHYGRIDCMINNVAMVGAVGSILDTPSDYWRATQLALLDSAFYGIKHAGRLMREQRCGVILSVSSIAGIMGGLGPHAFTAAKHAVVGLTRSAASELSHYGIRVNAIAPGNSEGASLNDLADTQETALSAAGTLSPLGTALSVDEIAAGLLFLASDAATHITGHTLVEDSGVTGAGAASGASVLKGQSTMRFVGASNATV